MENPQFTCISCAIAFVSADDQRDHYKSDHHRYNMKRRVAGLPPLDAHSFNQKVQERRAETALTASAKGKTCGVCRKVYTTENAYKSHLVSKKHRDREVASTMTQDLASNSAGSPRPKVHSTHTHPASATDDPADPGPDGPELGIGARIAAARSRIPPTSCLFCPTTSDSIDVNVSHMNREHSFFIPDQEYLVDLPGLLTYLGEKVAVDNVCLWCNGRGKALHSLDAVRKHMYDKSHCKIAYDTLNDRLDISDHYDFTSSYDMGPRARGAKSTTRRTIKSSRGEEDGWEDDDDVAEGDADEVVERDASDEEGDLDDLRVSYGDTPYELVLPTGARIGHRSLRRYYTQKFSDPLDNFAAYPNSETAIIKRLLKDKHSAQIPASGADFGGSGKVIKVRSLGVAKEAGRHVREYRDTRKKEQFKTKIGFVGNQQKHFRDQLLQ